MTRSMILLLKKYSQLLQLMEIHYLLVESKLFMLLVQLERFRSYQMVSILLQVYLSLVVSKDLFVSHQVWDSSLKIP